MAIARMTSHFEAPAERVFELVTDFKRYPEWGVNYSEILEVLGPTNHVGTRIHAVMRLLGRRMEGWAEIVEIDPPHLLKIRGTGNDGGSTTTTIRLTPVGMGTDAEMEVEYEVPGGLFGEIADRLFVERAAERDVRHSLENFKALVEVRQPALA